MTEILTWLFLIIVLPSLFYWLWVNGYMVLNMKRAALFVGSIRGENKCKAKFSSCDGYIKKVIKFSEIRNFSFDYASNITNGEVVVEITNKNKDVLVKLDSKNSTGIIIVEKKQRYYLLLKFEEAAGEIELTWN